MYNNNFRLKYVVIIIIFIAIIAVICLLSYLNKSSIKEELCISMSSNQNILSVTESNNESHSSSFTDEVVDTDLQNSYENSSTPLSKNNTIPSTQQRDDFNSNLSNTEIKEDEILTVNGIEKSYNTNIMSKYNIAYLLGLNFQCNSLSEGISDIDEYISNHRLKKGIYVSNLQLPNTLSNRTIIQNCLNQLDLGYLIDTNGYLISNNEIDEISTLLNNIINGNKTILIGTLPHYYTYIDDYDNQINLSSLLSPYIILEEYNNIITIIINDNEINGELILTALEDLYN